MLEALDNLPLILRMIVSLILVIALMGGLAMIIQRLGLTHGLPVKGKANPTIHITERQMVDPRRQLVTVTHRDQEYLLLLGASSETVLSSHALSAAKKPAKKSPKNKDKTT